jgi:hypothetical protein
MTVSQTSTARPSVSKAVRTRWMTGTPDASRCRQFRNSLMHFSPDPVTDDQLRLAAGLLELLRSLDPQGR